MDVSQSSSLLPLPSLPPSLCQASRLEARVEDTTQALDSLQRPVERQEEEQEGGTEGRQGRKEEGEEEWKERLQMEVETTVLERVEAGKVGCYISLIYIYISFVFSHQCRSLLSPCTSPVMRVISVDVG